MQFPIQTPSLVTVTRDNMITNSEGSTALISIKARHWRGPLASSFTQPSSNLSTQDHPLIVSVFQTEGLQKEITACNSYEDNIYLHSK
jgi:hypothetical protein